VSAVVCWRWISEEAEAASKLLNLEAQTASYKKREWGQQQFGEDG
jgi:hypothetical protein